MMKSFFLLLLGLSMAYGQGDAKTIQELYAQSYNYEQMGKYNEGIKVLIPLYLRYPKGYALNVRFGWLSYQNKRYNDAKKYYQIASKIAPTALDPRLGLIHIYLDTGSFDQAQTLSYAVLKLDYYNYYANLYAIQSLIAQKKYAIATTILFKMLALYPTDVSYLEQLAQVYQATHNRAFAPLCSDILALDPNNVFVRSLPIGVK